MFKLVAVIYVLLNGQIAGDAVTATRKIRFDTIEACKEHIDSDKGKSEIAQLSAQIAAQLPANGTHAITTSCEADDSV